MTFVCDTSDIDELSSRIRGAQFEPHWDIDNSGSLDSLDHKAWVHQLNNTYYGDANLDGEFNSSDLIAVFQAGEYEDGVAMNSTWVTGDWNGDGDFDTGDLVFAFRDGGFEAGPRVDLRPVPEPSTISLCGILGLLLVAHTTRFAVR